MRQRGGGLQRVEVERIVTDWPKKREGEEGGSWWSSRGEVVAEGIEGRVREVRREVNGCGGPAKGGRQLAAIGEEGRMVGLNIEVVKGFAVEGDVDDGLKKKVEEKKSEGEKFFFFLSFFLPFGSLSLFFLFLSFGYISFFSDFFSRTQI